MNKNNFKNLLVDLYNIYNPANISHIDTLVERYSRLEFDALKNIFIKYNRKSAPYYDINIGTDEYILNLINEYESGSRSLENVKLETQVIEIPKAPEKDAFLEIQEAQKEIKEEVADEIDKKFKNIKKYFDNREKAFKNQLEELYKDFEKKIDILKADNNDVTIRIFSTKTNSEMDIPNKKIIAGLGKGARLIIKDEDGRTIGLEIIDITYDGISDLEGKPLIEIFLEKI